MFSVSPATTKILDPVGLILVIDIKKDHTVVRKFMTVTAFILQLFLFLTAEFAPMVYKAVVSPANILFEAAVMFTVHPTVSVSGIDEEAVNHIENAGMSWRVMFFDLGHLRIEDIGGKINEWHRFLLIYGSNFMGNSIK